jgi:hypothetical protein
MFQMKLVRLLSCAVSIQLIPEMEPPNAWASSDAVTFGATQRMQSGLPA